MIRSTLNIVIIAVLALTTSCNSTLENYKTNKDSKIDSIYSFIEQARNISHTSKERETFLKKAYDLNANIKVDSLRRNVLIKLANASQYTNTQELFVKYNKEGFELSKKTKDTLGIAKYHFFYGLHFLESQNKMDSAYYHFNKSKIYNQFLKRKNIVAEILYYLAIIQYEIRNYTKSELLVFQSIELFNEINSEDFLHYCYNDLGMIYSELEDYTTSLEYHYKSIDLLKKTGKKHVDLSLMYTFNNIAFNYFKLNNYEKALAYYNDILNSKDIYNRDISLYSTVLHNKAFTRFKIGDTINVLSDFQTSLHLKDSLHDISGIIDSKLDIAEYYAFFKDSITATKYIFETKKLALSINKNRDYLRSLKLLSVFDRGNARQYLDEYISLNDSLQKEERKTRNLFTRIEFETEEYKEQVAKQFHEKLIILWIAIGITLILGLLYYIKLQRSKNHKLQFEKQQQKSNEEIYDLMLQQQLLKKEGRLKERQRVSEELHDGIIGKIFGTRMNLSFLNFTGSPKEEQKYKSLLLELQDVEKEIRVISHELKNEELEGQHTFESIIDLLVKNQCQVGQLNYTITTDALIDWDEVEGSIKTNIYRILQEALLNCLKHAEASEIHVSFKKTEKSLLLLIEDDGTGFDVKKEKKGIGLSNLKSRVNSMNGFLKVKSSMITGTQIDITIPNSKR